MGGRGIRIALVVGAAALTIPALLTALDRSAAFANTRPLIGGERRSLEGLRRRTAESLAAGRYQSAAEDARTVLAREPLDRTALRLLALAETGLGHADLADDLTIAASFVSWREPYTEMRMFMMAAEIGKLDDAARRADAVSRLDGSRAAGFGLLNVLLSSPGGAEAVAARLATRPPWRDAYFHDVQHGLAAVPQQAIPLLRALARTDAPASPSEVDRTLAIMVARGLAPDAWAYWRGLRGRAADAPVDDPDFQAVQVGKPDWATSPFVWAMPPDTLVRLVDRRDSAGRPALRIEAREDRSVLFVSRRVVVSPGRYRLSYEAAGAADQLDRLHPDLRCGDGVAVKLQPAGDAAIAEIPANCPLLRLGFTIETGDSATPAELSIRRVAFAKL